MKPVENVVFAENYTKEGVEKTRWHNVGVILEGEVNGKFRRVLKLTMMPVGNTVDGYFPLFKYEKRENNGGSESNSPKANNNYNEIDDRPIDLSEIPF